MPRGCLSLIGLQIRSIRLPTALEVRCLRRGIDGGRGKGKKVIKNSKGGKKRGWQGGQENE